MCVEMRIRMADNIHELKGEKNSCNLSVYFGHLDDELYYVDSYFDNCYEEDWFTSELAKNILKGIDRVYEINGLSFTARHFVDDKPVVISPDKLSSGTKALLILLNTDEQYVCVSRCGDNCILYLLEIAKEKPITITINNSFSPQPDFEFYSINDKKIFSTYEDFVRRVIEYCK